MPRLSLHHTRLAATLGLAAAAILIAPAAADAQASGVASRPGDTENAARKMGAHGQTNAQNNAAGNSQMSIADRKLMRELAQAHLAEIKTSALAPAISSNQAVRSYAEKML